jgi:serine-type D-Ala-D-Ala carboxypeptidase
MDDSSPHSPSLLVDAFPIQDEQFAVAFSILQNAISDYAFPAASIAVTHRGKLIALKAFGRFTYERVEKIGNNDIGDTPFLPSFGRSGNFPGRAGAPSLPGSLWTEGNFDFEVTPTTLFDLASLTKVVATTPMAMLLYERGLLDLDAPVAAIVPEFLTDLAKDPRRPSVTLRMLLAHSSGLPAYEQLFLKATTRDELLHAALTTSLLTDPGSRAVYSDIGFIILGIALERLADESLDRFCQREIFAPLAMASTTFNPPPELRAQIPPTADERSCGADTPVPEIPKSQTQSSPSQQLTRSTFRGRIIQGEVQDENANVLGGIAPHAGLFSNARDLAQFAHCMLNQGHSIFRPETVSLFTRLESRLVGNSRALGWDTPSSPSQSGKYFSPQSFGHLGYTGTSLWIDPARQLSITLLTNRTWPDCSNQAIKQIRPEFHEAIVEVLTEFN